LKRKLTCVLAAAVVGLPSPAMATEPVWKIQKKTGDVHFYQVKAVGEGDTWFFGDQYNSAPSGLDFGTAYHWDGRKTVKVPLPRQFRNGSIYDADFAAPDDGWLVGSTHDRFRLIVAHWDGKTWKLVRDRLPDYNPGYRDEPSVTALGSGRVLVTGIVKRDKPRTVTFDGKTWSEGTDTLHLRDFSQQYALSHEAGGRPGLRRWDGTHWNKVTVGALPKHSKSHPVDFQVLHVASHDNIWVVARRALEEGTATYVLHWDGRTWKRERAPLPSPHAWIEQIVPDGRGGFWASGDDGSGYFEDPTGEPVLYHRLPSGKWTKIKLKGMEFSDMAAVPGTTSLWAVGGIDHGSGGYLDWKKYIFTLNGPR
jgi:hypothetical protein